MAKAREIPEIATARTFLEAASYAVEARTDEVFSHREGVLDTGDIEKVHDMRVASRRLRAVLEMFEPCFPRREHRRALREVKSLADALGERRDRDVAVGLLDRIGGELTDDDGPGISGLAAHLRTQQQAANDGLARALATTEVSGLKTRLLALAADARARGRAVAQRREEKAQAQAEKRERKAEAREQKAHAEAERLEDEARAIREREGVAA